MDSTYRSIQCTIAKKDFRNKKEKKRKKRIYQKYKSLKSDLRNYSQGKDKTELKKVGGELHQICLRRFILKCSRPMLLFTKHKKTSRIFNPQKLN